jgi:hypothetical protein
MPDKNSIKFIDQLKVSNDKLIKLHNEVDIERAKVRQDKGKLEELENSLKEINPAFKPIYTNNNRCVNIKSLKWDDIFFLKNNPLITESRLQKEIYKNPKLLPSLSSIDFIMIGLAGSIATIIDFLVVKIPHDVNYLNKFQQSGSELTEWMKTLGIDENGKLKGMLKWLEDNVRVPYDVSHSNDIDGLLPRTHRLHSLGHDPLFGLLFGIIDILFGQMTALDKAGNLIILKTWEPSLSEKILSPAIWLGHIVSDICTKQGISIPGWGFTQLLQFGSLGKKGRTIGEISRWMYINGYDLRHFVTMSIQVAVIEIIIRGYHYLSIVKESDLNATPKPLYENEINKIENNLKLHKMLFLAHSFATAGNVAKIIVYQGNPLAINIAQWLRWFDESITMFNTIRRDKTTEKIIRNRLEIDRQWNEIQKIPINQLNLLTVDSSIYQKIFANEGVQKS